MRKRTWVLYHSSRYHKHFYIVQDKTTPIHKLEKLSHYIGIYRTWKEAYAAAKEATEFHISRLQENLKDLQRYRR